MKKLKLLFFILFLSCHSDSNKNYIDVDTSIKNKNSESFNTTASKYNYPVTINVDSISHYSYLLTLSVEPSKYIAQGTGFIVKTNKHYYLITAYHVISGRDPITDTLLNNFPADFKFITIWITPQSGKLYIKKTYQLFTENHQRKFFTIHAEIGTTDLAVLPLSRKSFPPNANIYAIEESNIDTTNKNIENKSVIIVGFPKANKLSDDSMPTVKSGKTLSIPDSHKQADVYYDVPTPEGMSGSPVYLYRNNNLKLAAVNDLENEPNTSNIQLNRIKGAGADILYAIQIINIIDSKIKDE